MKTVFFSLLLSVVPALAQDSLALARGFYFEAERVDDTCVIKIGTWATFYAKKIVELWGEEEHRRITIADRYGGRISDDFWLEKPTSVRRYLERRCGDQFFLNENEKTPEKPVVPQVNEEVGFEVCTYSGACTGWGYNAALKKYGWGYGFRSDCEGKRSVTKQNGIVTRRGNCRP